MTVEQENFLASKIKIQAQCTQHSEYGFVVVGLVVLVLAAVVWAVAVALAGGSGGGCVNNKADRRWRWWGGGWRWQFGGVLALVVWRSWRWRRWHSRWFRRRLSGSAVAEVGRRRHSCSLNMASMPKLAKELVLLSL